MLKGIKNGKKPSNVRLGNEERASFQQLKQTFTNAPVLRHFEPEKPIIVETDASNFAIGAILSQVANDGRKHPIAFWSSKFKGPALSYSTADKELMAIIECFKQ